MKKIMIALAAVAMAIGAQAATYNWKAAAGYIYSPTDSSVKLSSGTAYLFNAGQLSEQALLTAILGGSDISTLSYVATGSVNANGQVAVGDNFTYNDVAGGQTWNAYMAIVDGDYLYISNEKTGIIAPSDQSATAIAIGSNSSSSKQMLGTTDTYSTAGWYETAAVPEPTSALMLLIGMAGLALRRKQA